MGSLGNLLAEARAAGLTVEADGDRLVVRGPRDQEVLAKAVLANKGLIMAELVPVITVDTDHDLRACPRCRSTDHIDVVIHNGASMRRDCADCRRFVSFPIWYGEVTA